MNRNERRTLKRLTKNGIVQRWKIRVKGAEAVYAKITENEKPWGNGCECSGCLCAGEINGRCFDGVVRELCANHYASRNIESREDA